MRAAAFCRAAVSKGDRAARDAYVQHKREEASELDCLAWLGRFLGSSRRSSLWHVRKRGSSVPKASTRQMGKMLVRLRAVACQRSRDGLRHDEFVAR